MLLTEAGFSDKVVGHAAPPCAAAGRLPTVVLSRWPYTVERGRGRDRRPPAVASPCYLSRGGDTSAAQDHQGKGQSNASEGEPGLHDR